MTSFSQIVFEPGGVALSVFALLTLFGQIYAVISSFSQKRSIILRLTMVLQFVLGLCWFCLLLDGSFTVDYFDRRRAYLGLTRLIFGALDRGCCDRIAICRDPLYQLYETAALWAQSSVKRRDQGNGRYAPGRDLLCKRGRHGRA